MTSEVKQIVSDWLSSEYNGIKSEMMALDTGNSGIKGTIENYKLLDKKLETISTMIELYFK